MSAYEKLSGSEGASREEMRITGSYENLRLEDRVAYASIFGKVAREALKIMAERREAADNAGLAATEAITNGFKYDEGGVTEVVVMRTEVPGEATLEVTVTSPTLTESTPTKDNMGAYAEDDTHGRGGLLIEELSGGNWMQRNITLPDGSRELHTSIAVHDASRRPKPNGHPPDSMGEAA